jgi:iron complex outermembrane receptor protein
MNSDDRALRRPSPPPRPPPSAGCSDASRGGFARSPLLNLFLQAAISLWWILGGITVSAATPGAAEAEPVPDGLTELSLDELTRVQFVTSVAKKPQKLENATAAIHLMTSDTIARTPATTVPDLLREVPGLFVGSVDAHTWAISSRGFNDAFGNKLLVLLDGRSVYTPLFSGVYWDVQDTILEDLERIEVVRGPGGTMWGANAVNGVINLTTKHTRETQGMLVSAGGGNEDQAIGAVRYGATIGAGSNAFFRVYAKYNQRDGSELLTGSGNANDRWHLLRGGFRADWEPNPRDQLTFQGDVSAGEEDQTYSFATLTAPDYRATSTRPTDLLGAHALARWTRALGDESELRLQAYYDRTDRETVLLHEQRDTADVDLQHRFQLGSRQEINWGAGYRYTRDDLRDSFPLSFQPRQRGDHLFSWFAQNELTLVPDRLELTGGIKLEHNDYTGFEYQPRGSLHFQVHDHHSLWAAFSRAVRTPSRAEHDFRLNDQVFGGAPPVVVSIFGHPDFRSETVLAYEAGYRFQPAPRFSTDLAVFYNEYRHLRTTESVGSPDFDASLPGAPLVQRVNLDNKANGETFGAEFAVRWAATGWWDLHGSYSALDLQLHRSPTSNAGDAELDEDKAPHHQLRLRSAFTFSREWRLDLIGRYVDAIADFNIKGYWELDARLAWSPRPNLEISLNGRNLLHSSHAEFWPTILGTQRTEVQRGVFALITYRF